MNTIKFVLQHPKTFLSFLMLIAERNKWLVKCAEIKALERDSDAPTHNVWV